MILDPPCHFCKDKTESGGSQTGSDPFTHIIRHCNHCDSEQHFIYGTNTCLSFSLKPKSESKEYYVHYDLRTRRLIIYHIDYSEKSGLKWIPQVETILSEYPAWLAHDYISDHRIQTLKVFS